MIEVAAHYTANLNIFSKLVSTKDRELNTILDVTGERGLEL